MDGGLTNTHTQNPAMRRLHSGGDAEPVGTDAAGGDGEKG